MLQNRYIYFILIGLLMVVLAGCERNKTVCAPEDETPQAPLQLADLINQSPPTSASSEPVQVEIQGKNMEVDKLVDYPLCNDNWSGTVYVSCDVQMAEAEKDTDKNPLFLQGCNLNIEPNTIVYVAAHNDAAYYNGCSCHTGQQP